MFMKQYNRAIGMKMDFSHPWRNAHNNAQSNKCIFLSLN